MSHNLQKYKLIYRSITVTSRDIDARWKDFEKKIESDRFSLNIRWVGVLALLIIVLASIFVSKFFGYKSLNPVQVLSAKFFEESFGSHVFGLPFFAEDNSNIVLTPEDLEQSSSPSSFVKSATPSVFEENNLKNTDKIIEKDETKDEDEEKNSEEGSEDKSQEKKTNEPSENSNSEVKGSTVKEENSHGANDQSEQVREKEKNQNEGHGSDKKEKKN